MNRVLYLVLRSLGLAVVGTALLVVSVPASAHDPQPALKWVPGIVSTSVPRGSFTPIKVRFTATRALGDLRLIASTNVPGAVSVSPATFTNVLAGQTLESTIWIDSPFQSRTSVIAGLVVASTSDSSRPWLLPLPLIIKTTTATRGSVLTGVGTVSFNAPAGWAVVSDGATNSSNLFGPANAAAIDKGDSHTPPDVAIRVEPNPGGVSLQQFVSSYREGKFARYVNSRSQALVGAVGIVVDDEGSDVPFEPLRAAIAPLVSGFLVVSAYGMSAADFDSLLSSLTVQ